MPSGNAWLTYVGDEPTITWSGTTFVKDEPQHVTDVSVIEFASEREDFVEGDPDAKPKKTGAKK